MKIIIKVENHLIGYSANGDGLKKLLDLLGSTVDPVCISYEGEKADLVATSVVEAPVAPAPAPEAPPAPVPEPVKAKPARKNRCPECGKHVGTKIGMGIHRSKIHGVKGEAHRPGKDDPPKPAPPPEEPPASPPEEAPAHRGGRQKTKLSLGLLIEMGDAYFGGEALHHFHERRRLETSETLLSAILTGLVRRLGGERNQGQHIPDERAVKAWEGLGHEAREQLVMSELRGKGISAPA